MIGTYVVAGDIVVKKIRSLIFNEREKIYALIILLLSLIMITISLPTYL